MVKLEWKETQIIEALEKVYGTRLLLQSTSGLSDSKKEEITLKTLAREDQEPQKMTRTSRLLKI